MVPFWVPIIIRGLIRGLIKGTKTGTIILTISHLTRVEPTHDDKAAAVELLIDAHAEAGC